MVQFYETYSSESFTKTVNHYGMQNYLIGAERKQLPSVGNTIVPVEMAQIPNVLFSTGWTNHQIIMSKCKNDSERMFYMLYAGREQLENKELTRAIKTDTMSSLLRSKTVQSKMMKQNYPQSGVLFKDTVYLEMFGLPVKYKESKLRKEIIAHMKDFILEMGKDADMEVVRYALNRSMSPTMVALYKEQLQAGGVIKRSLEEFCNYLTEGKSKN